VVAADETDRRSRLRSVMLSALVRDHLGGIADVDVQVEVGAFAPGAGLTVGGQAWVLAQDEPQRGLGPAIAWALRRDADEVHVLAEHGSGTLARRAQAFGRPRLHVWRVVGRELQEADAEALPEPPAPRPEHVELTATIRAGGATPALEHGVVTGEVRGLEVCRVVDDPSTGAVRLEVGVGVHDREAFTMIHGDIPTVEALRGVVDAVEQHRRADGPPHPLNRLAQARLLRWRLIQDPSAVGLHEVVAVEPPVPRIDDLRRAVPCVAHGHDAAGGEIVVVCSVGVDLDVIPYATDARLAAAHRAGVAPGDMATMVVTPARDRVPVTEELAASLVHPVQLASPA